MGFVNPGILILRVICTKRNHDRYSPEPRNFFKRKASIMSQPSPEGARYAIYPPIGIARVGNSPEGEFLAPQVPGEVPSPPYKDEKGAVKRQVALFRVYELDSQGQAIREITASEAEIEWHVHLANRKAAWYQFNNAMDLCSNHLVRRLGYGTTL